MTSDIANIITDYRERCARQLQGAVPDSAEYIAYDTILQTFDQNQTGEPSYRFLRIYGTLISQAEIKGAHPLAPNELRVNTAKACGIMRKWAEDFKKATGHTGI